MRHGSELRPEGNMILRGGLVRREYFNLHLHALFVHKCQTDCDTASQRNYSLKIHILLSRHRHRQSSLRARKCRYLQYGCNSVFLHQRIFDDLCPVMTALARGLLKSIHGCFHESKTVKQTAAGRSHVMLFVFIVSC